jgi:hypothetical protein
MCGTLFVKIKNALGRYFGGHKGVWQGDPISPLIFNLTGDSLPRMFKESSGK